MGKLLVICVSFTVISLIEINGTEIPSSTKYRHQNSKGASNPNRKNNEISNNTEVVAQVGGVAALRCHTPKLPDQLVTWMKRGEEQLLTAGLQVYSSEKRYSVAHLRHQKVWELRIRDVKATDAGAYECQMTTHPPKSILFRLKVIQAQAIIDGPHELHVHEGSRLRLHCHVESATEPPLYMFWFHNDSMINFDDRRPLKVTKQLFSSTLMITDVSRTDAGSYKCEPHLALPDNVTLHVLAGENSAAMQKEQESEEGTTFAQTSSSSGANILSSSSQARYWMMLVLILCVWMFNYEKCFSETEKHLYVGKYNSSPKKKCQNTFFTYKYQVKSKDIPEAEINYSKTLDSYNDDLIIMEMNNNYLTKIRNIITAKLMQGFSIKKLQNEENKNQFNLKIFSREDATNSQTKISHIHSTLYVKR